MRTALLDLSGFSGQTAKSSPWLRARQNGGNGLNLGGNAVRPLSCPFHSKERNYRWGFPRGQIGLPTLLRIEEGVGIKQKSPLLRVKSEVF